MSFIKRNLNYLAAGGAALIVGIAEAGTFGQDIKSKHDKNDRSHERSFCSDNNYWTDENRTSFHEMREMAMASVSKLTVEGGNNGGISVKGEDRGDIAVRACVQAWGSTEADAKAAVSAIRITTGSTIKADNASGDKNWSVSFQIMVPRHTDLDLSAHNGGISISGTDGSIEFETQNGGVNLDGLAGDVKGRTVNGGVRVNLAGNSWRGRGLDVQTTNGGVRVTLPSTYAARIETGTVNGGFHSDVPAINVTTENLKGDDYGRSRTKHVVTDLNGGGAPIKIVTTNGGVNISTSGD